MFHTPTSSAKMTRMFGFLPSLAALSAAASLWDAKASIPALERPSEQQPGAVGAAFDCSAGRASAFWDGRPKAAAYPSSAPSTIKAPACIFVFAVMMDPQWGNQTVSRSQALPGNALHA